MVNLRAAGAYNFSSLPDSEDLAHSSKNESTATSRSKTKGQLPKPQFKPSQSKKKTPINLTKKQEQYILDQLTSQEKDVFNPSTKPTIHKSDQHLMDTLVHSRQALTSTWQNIELVQETIEEHIPLNHLESSLATVAISKKNI